MFRPLHSVAVDSPQCGGHNQDETSYYNKTVTTITAMSKFFFFQIQKKIFVYRQFKTHIRISIMLYPNKPV